MRTLFQLISHEYRKYVFTWGFFAFILILPTFAILGYIAGTVSEKAAPTRTFIVVDETGKYTDYIDEALEDAGAKRLMREWDEWAAIAIAPAADGSFPLAAPFAPAPRTDARRAAFREAGGVDAGVLLAGPHLVANAPDAPDTTLRSIRIAEPPEVAAAGSIDAKADILRAYIRGDRSVPGTARGLFAAFIIPENFEPRTSENSGVEISYLTDNLIDQNLRSFVDEAVTAAVKQEAYEAAGVDVTVIERIDNARVDFAIFKATTEDGGEVGLEESLRVALPLAFAYFLVVLVFSIGGMLLSSTVEEKSNKIVEVLLSSVSASQLMAGKLIGLALVGLTFPVIVLTLGFIGTELILANPVLAATEPAGLLLQARAILTSSALLPVFLFYFVGGYLMFASMFLGVGAMCNSIQDTQTFMTPLTLVMLAPAPFLMMIINDPNGLLARIFTWIPLYTPYAILVRLSGEPPRWEIIGATVLYLLVVAWVLVTMGRIYRNGVLSTGGAPSFKDIGRLARKSG